ncbi:MAG: hypothetical protein OXH28_08035 [bacterium]|nr:hypothetical protein [bacterium]
MAEPENLAAEDLARSGRDHLRLLGGRVAPLTGARERTLPVLDPLRDLFGDGALQRGWVIAAGGEGATSLALAVAAGPSAAGSWTAVVGDPGLGLAAAAEAGVVLERLLMVDAPGSRGAVEAVAALVGAVDVVLLGPEVRLGAADHRRLAARLRERGSVLIRLAESRGHGSDLWAGEARSSNGWAGDPHGADVCLRVVSSHWSGLEDGWGLLRSRRVSVQVTGRGAASRSRSVDLLLPGPDGSPVLLEPAAGDATTPLRSTAEGSTDLGCPGTGDAAVVA